MTKKKKRDPHLHKLVGLRLEEAIRQEVQALADADDRTLSKMCTILIREALAARREKK